MMAPPSAEPEAWAWLTVRVAFTSVPFQLHLLRLVIRLSMAIVAASNVGDQVEIRRLTRIRDDEYTLLEGWAATRFRSWPTMPKEELDALLATGGAPS